jgi:hypothetical protein
LRNPTRTIAVALVAALAVVAAARRYLPDLLSPYRFEDDARQHVWWTYRYADPSLFEGDLGADYFSAPTFAPLGYRLLARTFVPWIDAQTYAEIVPFVLTAIVAVLAVLIGQSASGGSWLGAAAAGVFALQGGVLARVESGLPRAWAMPVLLFGVWTVLEKRWATFGVALLLVAVFYPPLIVNLGLFGGSAWLIEVLSTRRPPRGLVLMAGCAAAALALVVFAYKTPSPDPMGPKVSEAVARTMAEFGPEGRSHFFADDPVDFYVSNVRSGLGFEPWKLAAFAAVLLVATWAFPRAVPRVAWLLPATALAGFAAAHAVLFKLHLPSRYTRFALPAFFLVWIAAMAPAVVLRLRRHPRAARVIDALGRPRVLVPVLGVVVAFAAGEAAWRIRGEAARAPAQGYPELIRFVSGLPADTVIAAHPTDASDFPLLTRRSVLACEETSTPYDLGYYAIMKERIEAELRACFAADWKDVDALERFGVDLFVVDRARYRRPVDAARAYYEPFRTTVAPALALAAATGFVLENPPPERIAFQTDRYLVVRVKEQ